ncbi:MAG: NAD(P)-dependent oxidoreductase [Burkholderiaceae bacterium]|jgi:3-hydroxyisobutyrate dehydrogenase-like beta-hydroxyacid dehydrogenase|nr:NAD(P)-dependent oxidoreductase [Burkholderiaceae bacterium]
MNIDNKLTQERPRIGLIGLGLMGHGIGRNLLKGGYSLTVIGNVNRKPIESLVGLGAVEAPSLAALTLASDIIILCVTGSPQVESLMYGADGILANGRSGQIVIDCSTSEPSSSDRINADLRDAGITFVDAPLGRTPVEAEAGTLNTMVGATPEVLELIRPVLQAFCENIIHVGSVLSAQKLKLINNFAIVGTVALITEALRTCDQVGIDRSALYSLMSKGPLKSTLLQMTAEEILKNNFEGMKFSIRNAQKDISYFNNMVAHGPEAASLSSGLSHVLALAVEQGLGDKYLPSLVKAE